MSSTTYMHTKTACEVVHCKPVLLCINLVVSWSLLPAAA